MTRDEIRPISGAAAGHYHIKAAGNMMGIRDLPDTASKSGILCFSTTGNLSTMSNASLDPVAAVSNRLRGTLDPNLTTRPVGVDRRLPRAGDVPDDGRGAQTSARWPAGCRVTGFWELLCHHQSHVEWVGCSLHDLIQPSFSFLVGVALALFAGQPAGARAIES